MKARLQPVSLCVVAALTLLAGAEPSLAYARTDIGGVYRRDADRGRWIPLQDVMPQGNWFGIESIAPDPVDADIVYAAAGMYRRDPAAADARRTL